MVFSVCFTDFVMANACLRQLVFWACANVNHLNTSLSVLCNRCKKWQNYCKKIFLAFQIKFGNFQWQARFGSCFFLNLFVCNNLCLCKSVQKKMEKWFCQNRVCFHESVKIMFMVCFVYCLGNKACLCREGV